MNFNIGDYVVYKNYTVCQIEAIEKPKFIKKSDQLYYKLKSVFSTSGETTYIPTESEIQIRNLITATKALEYLDVFRILEPEICNAKQAQALTEHFEAIYNKQSIESCLLIIKEILIKENEAKKLNRNLKQQDSHYLALTEKPICEEFGFVLQKNPNEIKEQLRAMIVTD